MLIDSLNKFRRKYPESQKVAFFMTKFSNAAPYPQIFEALKKIYSENGLTLLRADEEMFHQDLYTNIETYMHSCGSGIAFFDKLKKDDFNPNVAFEVGYMMSLKKPVCLLKDENNGELQADLMGKLYVSIDTYNPEISIRETLSQWLRDNELCLNCSECYITLKNNFIQDGRTPEKIDMVENGLHVIKKPSHTLKWINSSNNEEKNTICRYECSNEFYEEIERLFKSGALKRIFGAEVLNVSPTPLLGYKNYDYVFQVSTFQEGSDEKKKLIHVCKANAIESWYSEKHIAESLFKVKQTTNLYECEVYITSRDTVFYFHSNFLIKGYNYPTKINAYEGHYNLLEIFKILTTNHVPDLNSVDVNTIVAHSTKVKYYIDRSMIDKSGKLKIDLDGARNVKFVPDK